MISRLSRWSCWLWLGWLVSAPGVGAAGSFGDGAAAYSLQDYAKAAAEWRPLAEAGDARAQFRLGDLYESGRGLPRDPAQAAQWYERAAQAGHAQAALRLGDLYRQGRGVVQDAGAAVQWYERAARAGDGAAAYRLAEMLAAGTGIARDPGMAAAWLKVAECRLSAPAQVRQAAAARALLEARLSPARMAAAEAGFRAILGDQSGDGSCPAERP